MEHADLRKSSRNPHTSRATKERFPSPHANRSLRLRDQFKSEKFINQYYTYLHHEVKQNIASGPLLTPRPSWNYQKQSLEKKTMKDDELIKHMSKLPRYLQRVERGENVQEKVLNFGVLDWQRLEKWKDNQKQVSGRISMSSPSRVSMSSPSNSNTSSVFSTVESSSLSSESDSGIHTRRKQAPSQHPHLTTSSKGIHSQGMIRPTGQNVPPQKATKTTTKNASVGQQKLHGIYLPSGNNCLETKFEKVRERGSDPTFSLEMGIKSSKSTSEISFGPKSKIKVPEGAPTQGTEKSQEVALSAPNCSGSDRNIVLLLPRNSVKKSSSGVPQQAETTRLNSDRKTEANCRRFSDRFCISEEVQFSELHSDIPHSCPELPRIETSKHSDMNLATSIDARAEKISSDYSHFSPCSAEIPTIQSKDKQAEEKILTTKPTKVMVVEPFYGSGLRTMELSATKGRSQSPNCRSSSGVNKISRSCSSKECSALPQLSSSYVTAKSGSVVPDACSNNSSRDKATANGRGRSSPLRRLLDPLLKPKSVSRVNSTESLQDESCISFDGSSDPSAQPAKRVLNFSTSRLSNISAAHQDEKHMVSMVQALLQVSVKNGLPWFTFAVNNNSDILAATMTKVSASGKYDCSWIYTFYSFHRTKKKIGGWINPVSNVKSHDYVRSVVGQMKVSGSHVSKLTRHDSKDQVMVREFVLFGAKPRQTNQESLVSHQNSELAAVVIRVPKEAIGNSVTNDGQLGNNHNHVSTMTFPECSPEKKSCYNSVDNPKSGPTIVSQNLAKVAVILPSGVHGLPVTGLPSPLIDRWRSGGSCDCGGWDVGCKLRVLSNLGHCGENDACPPKVWYTNEQIDLFPQGEGAQEKCPYFSMLTYNKGVHSVDFNASVSTLQAFSICIAFLHSKNLAKVGNLFEDINTHEPVSGETERVKCSSQIEGKAPSSTALPPRSPVGRV